MKNKILISSDGITIEGTLYDSPGSTAVWNSLPLEGLVNLWGKEIYFATSLVLEEDPASQDIVDLGAIAYWPPGQALCLFFGQTPMSQGNECRAASPVTIIGHMDEDFSNLNQISSGSVITVVPQS